MRSVIFFGPAVTVALGFALASCIGGSITYPCVTETGKVCKVTIEQPPDETPPIVVPDPLPIDSTALVPAP